MPTAPVRFPSPLRPGDTVAVTAPSSGVRDSMWGRLEAAVDSLRRRGYDVRVGAQIHGGGVTGSAEARAAELTAMLSDPDIAAVVPPWGGELAVQVLDHLDWTALAAADPTWLVGFSDLTTLMLPLATRLGWASLHGANLMDSPYEPVAGLLHWTEVAAATGPVRQTSPGRFRTSGWDDYTRDPGVTSMSLEASGGWQLVGASSLDVSGRLIGGCVDVLSPIAGTAYADVPGFGRAHAEDGLVVYLEAAEESAYAVCRMLHGLRMAGWFEHARAILIGRTGAPDAPDLSQREAVLDALGGVGVPIVLDVECGHVQPYAALVNGALARVVVDGERREIVQEWSADA